jgi:predicted PolB exonuclease-like 3'-5' exonuclease
MFKTVANELWAFDSEWTPDPVAGRRLYHLPDEMSDREVIRQMWKQGGATPEQPHPFLKLALCRVVSIAAVIRMVRPDGSVQLELKSLPKLEESGATQDEAEMLALFLNTVGHRGPQLVGFHSHAADIKIMMQRAIIKGVSAPTFCKRPDKPWEEGTDYFSKYSDDHVDLKEIVSGFGQATPSLHELATLSGIPGKLGVAGDDVAQMWLDGKLKEIVAYNETDALTTYLVWLRVAHFAGFFTDEQYEQEQNLVRGLIAEKLQDSGDDHLKAYQEEWARLRSLTTN